jgi:multidrug resistance efflux pump
MRPRTVLLWAVWLGAVVAAAILYYGSPSTGAVEGSADVSEARVGPAETGRVAQVHVAAGDRVSKGVVVAVMDPVLLLREKEVAESELRLAETELAGRQSRLGRDRLSQERSFAGAAEQAEADLMEARVQADRNRAELSGVQSRLAWWKNLVDSRMASAETLEELKAEAGILQRRIVLDDRAVAVRETQATQARNRLRTWKTAGGASDEAAALESELAPFRDAVTVARARLALLATRLEGLTLRSPVDGWVHKVQLNPGDVARAGDVVVLIRASSPRRVLAYPSEATARKVVRGTRAEVITRDGRVHRMKGRVVGVGSGRVRLPEVLQAIPGFDQWGEEVVILLDREEDLVPGQLLDITFDIDDVVPDAVAGPALPDPPSARPVAPAEAAPVPLKVPGALAAATRVEPSGLIWVPELDRYLVVTDDTGPDSDDSHPPLLLALARDGAFDEKPIRVEGIDVWNDLESIARTADGSLWVLSSQTVSAKGKRPRDRTLLVRLAVEDGKVRATGHASLYDALLAAPAEAVEGLGLGERPAGLGTRTWAPELNVEGMTGDGDGLLLGVKKPLDGEGRAVLWRLARPADLIRTGRLEPGDFVVWGRVALATASSGRAGIADLLRVPGGGLAILAVAVADGPGKPPPDGALWFVPAPGTGGVLAGTKVRDFPGLRAEGLALAPSGDGLAIVFDRDAETPLWLRTPVPR